MVTINMQYFGKRGGSSGKSGGAKSTKYYYDPDDKQIKKGDFETIAVSRSTGKSNKVQFEYDPDDNEVVAIVNGKRYRKASLERHFKLQ